jgi:transposase InsO family protein
VTGTTSRVAPWSSSCTFKEYKGLCAARRRQPSPIQRSLAPDDKVNRQFVATMPDQLWVWDFTYVST